MRIDHTGSKMRLLDSVGYVSRALSKIKNVLGEDITVADTFPYNPDSKSSPKTADKWARGYSHSKNFVPPTLTRINEPFEITIVALDIRSQGGRAYKVVDAFNRQFDLREDEIMDIIKYCGINPGGNVPGTFVWGVLGSAVRLVLVGGDIHQEMAEQSKQLKKAAQARAAGNAPTAGNMQVNHIYRKRDGSEHIFVGRVKQPGSTKTSFAFVEAPEPPLHSAPDFYANPPHWLNQDAINYQKKVDAVGEAWPTMSWADRFEWEQFGKNDYPGRGRQLEKHYVNIKLVTSPKFEADVGVCDDAVVTSFRDNVGTNHCYVGGVGYWHDLAEQHYAQAVGHSRDSERPQNNSWNTPYAESQRRQDEWYKKVQHDVKEYREQFQKGMTWL